MGNGQRNTAGSGPHVADRSHQILAMRTHLTVPNHGYMDPASARYMIRINGQLGATLLTAFPGLTCHQRGRETLLTGVLDQAGLYGVLAEIETLGLQLLEVRQEGVIPE